MQGTAKFIYFNKNKIIGIVLTINDTGTTNILIEMTNYYKIETYIGRNIGVQDSNNRVKYIYKWNF